MSRIARAHLRADPALGPLIDRVGPLRLKPLPRSPYEALIRAIAHQQLHGRAAEAILGRFAALYPAPFPEPEAVLATDPSALRAVGLSGAKIAAIRDICARALDGTIPGRRAAARMRDDALIERLCLVRGVGRWTVEMLLIFTLGRHDVLPVDDFGVREGFRALHGLDRQPTPKALATIGAVWAPWRSHAALYLWRAADEARRQRTERATSRA